MRVFGPTNGRVDRRYRLAATELGGRGNKEVYTCHIETEGSEKVARRKVRCGNNQGDGEMQMTEAIMEQTTITKKQRGKDKN